MLAKSLMLALTAVSTALAVPQSGRPDFQGRPGFPVRPGDPTTTTTATATAGPGNPTTTPAPGDGGDDDAPAPSEFAFNPPTLKPFFHIDLALSFPVNATTLDGATAQIPIVGGNITGDLNGIVLPGVYWENLPPESEGTASFFDVRFLMNTTEDTTLLFHSEGVITYANEALHAFGRVAFNTAEPGYLDLNWRSFVIEFEGYFNTGSAWMDVFELETGGRLDGTPIRALEPPA